MRAPRLSCAFFLALIGVSKIAFAEEYSLKRMAQSLIPGQATKPCPFAITTEVREKSGDYVLSISLTNVSKRTFTVPKVRLPWTAGNVLAVAAITMDGHVIAAEYERADRIDNFDKTKVIIRPSQTVSGDYPLAIRWSAAAQPPTEFPRDSDIVLFWTFEVVAAGFGKEPAPSCSGVAAFRSSK
jgi:hypothetical protein